MPVTAAFSTCPNDTFTFHAWVEGIVAPEIPVQTALADIQKLNRAALEGVYPLSKISFHTLGHVLDKYIMLPVGAALGRGCGPKLIAREGFSLDQLGNKRMAIPGKDTTTHLLTQIVTPSPKEKVFCLYDEVTERIRTGQVDCGVIIHETRFTFQQDGFVEIADIGELWEQEFDAMVPLGCLVGKRSLGEEKLASITAAIQRSLVHAWKYPEASREYVLRHSLEKDPQVVQSHIDLFVTEDSKQLSEAGVRSIATLFRETQRRDLMPSCDKSWLFEMLPLEAL